MFDLQEIGTSSRFSYWKEVLCNVYVALESAPTSRSNFVGSVTEHPFSNVSVSKISSQRQVITRSPKGIRRDSEAYCFLNLQVKGSCRVIQADRETITDPGEFSIVDSTEPFVHDYFTDEWEMVSFKIPKAMVATKMDIRRDVVARKVSDKTPVGKIVVEYLMSIAQRPDSLEPSALDLNRVMLDFIELSLGQSQDPHQGPRRTFRSGLCRSISNYVELHFANPQMSPSKAAAHFGISTRYLHMVLAEQGETFSQKLLKFRLGQSARNLIDRRFATISEAAYGAGFNDLSHFSRAFRAHYGMSPREYRNAAPDEKYQTRETRKQNA
ncbi:helix-turn-helix domain-containing protein (plasmid) [Shinella sp. H4-D48]|uniref:helix-turn-helix domain-containing protein n=1 Tax=Shinella sp. H4-D48 TaxID=2925841 RepID=UPI001F537F61|nr:helix-turn-helix domain-containing protein [Shinella sp. H4-D48]UNK40934.1 helix-turn-helix domain-containing protein [Shinella sp. H4-D48]